MIFDSHLTFGAFLRYLRKRAQMTQEELANQSGYDANYISMIERDVRSPTRNVVQALAHALGLQGQEYDQFLLKGAQRRGSVSLSPQKSSDISRQDWGEAPHTKGFLGREHELACLEQWIGEDHCQMVAVLGLGGIGKTVLTARLARYLANTFEYVYWRILQNAPPFKDLLHGCFQFLSDRPSLDTSKHDDELISQLLDSLQKHRCLLILDNFESVLQGGNQEGLYAPGYEGYGRLVQRVGESPHRSCLIITSREKPKEIGQLEGTTLPTRSLTLTGVKEEEGRAILSEKGLFGSDEDWAHLIQRYSGNPLALKLISEPVRELFGCVITAFLKGGGTVGGIHDLLKQQFKRLSVLEQEIMYWLAIEREPLSLNSLQDARISSASKGEVFSALASLRRRSMIEMSSTAYFTLQPVIMEYVTTTFVRLISEEIQTENLQLFATHALIMAQAKDYIRESQKHLILLPIAQRLLFLFGKQESERKLSKLLTQLRQIQPESYTAGNILNLLVQLNIDLRGYDFSYLTIRQAYLQGVALPEVNFNFSNLETSVFTDIFGNVLSVKFSPDGKFLAGGTSSAEMWIWNAKNGTPLKICEDHQDWVWCVAFSPDGNWIASGSSDRTIRLWEANTGQCVQILRGHTDILKCATFSPDGTVLASGGSDQTLRLWEVKTGQCFKVLTHHTDVIRSVTFSPDGNRIASGSDDGTICLWEVASGECIKVFHGHEGRVHTVAFHPDGNWIASGGDDQLLRLWEARTGTCIKILQGHSNVIREIDFSSNGTRLASGSDDQTIRLWEARTGQMLRTFQGHTNRVLSVAFSPDDEMLASGSDDHTIRLWQGSTGRCLRILQGHTNWIKSVAFSPDGLWLASGSEDRKVRLWEVSSGRCVLSLNEHTNLVRSVAFSPDGHILASGSDDHTIRLWAPDTGRCLKILSGHTNWVQSLAFSPDGRLLASSSDDHTIRLWAPDTGECLAILRGHSNRVYSVAFSPDGCTLVSGSDDQTIRFWEMSTLSCTQTLKGHSGRVYSVTFSHDGTKLASGGSDATIRLWEASTGKEISVFRGHSSWVMPVTFSLDDTILASGSEDRTLRIWEVSTARLLQTYRDHAHTIRSLVFSPDGRLLASGSHDETIKLWKVLTNERPRTLVSNRPYEGMNMTNIRGLSKAQRTALQVLGAISEAEKENLG